jgi:hypothetical protein
MSERYEDLVMDTVIADVAELVAWGFWKSGYAFVEDEKLGEVAAMLKSFLETADIPVNDGAAIAYYRESAEVAQQ